MSGQQDSYWTLILAAGAGTRLRSLTTKSDGQAIPKQFCSLNGGPSLMRQTLARALRLTPMARVATIVAEEHRAFWLRDVAGMFDRNVIVQPQNRGTALGILLPVLKILRIDPQARILLLPSDHFVEREAVLEQALRDAMDGCGNDLCLVGIEPEHADPELGYILPRQALGNGVRAIDRFVEKPNRALCAQLISNGAVWNTFVIAAKGIAIVDLINQRFPELVRELRGALLAKDAAQALRAVYAASPSVDFSRDVVEGMEGFLRVVRAGSCGWTDLGTPERVASCVDRGMRGMPFPLPFAQAPINLAEAYRLRLHECAVPRVDYVAARIAAA